MHAAYVEVQLGYEPPRRALSYDRWCQYRNYFFPGLRLTKTREDVCDGCYRIETRLLDPTLTLEEREFYELEKTRHLDAAIGQRRK